MCSSLTGVISHHLPYVPAVVGRTAAASEVPPPCTAQLLLNWPFPFPFPSKYDRALLSKNRHRNNSGRRRPNVAQTSTITRSHSRLVVSSYSPRSGWIKPCSTCPLTSASSSTVDSVASGSPSCTAWELMANLHGRAAWRSSSCLLRNGSMYQRHVCITEWPPPDKPLTTPRGWPLTIILSLPHFWWAGFDSQIHNTVKFRK